MSAKFVWLSIFFLHFFGKELPARAVDSGWRKPNMEQFTGDWRLSSSNRYLSVIEDFDGDGKRDRCTIMTNVKKGEWGIRVNFADEKTSWLPISGKYQSPEWKEDFERNRGIKVGKQGRYKTACGKGYWECDKVAGDMPDVEIRNAGIILFRNEAGGTVLFYWNSKLGKFDSQVLDD